MSPAPCNPHRRARAMRRARRPWRKRRWRCMPWSTRDGPRTPRSRPRSRASIARRCAPSRSAPCVGICDWRPRSSRCSSRPFAELSPQLAALLVDRRAPGRILARRRRGAGAPGGGRQPHRRRSARQRDGQRSAAPLRRAARRVVSRRRPRPGAPPRTSTLAGGRAGRGLGWRSAPSRSWRPTIDIRPWRCGSIPRRCRSRISSMPGARWAARRTPSNGIPTPWCWNTRPLCRRCPASIRRRCRCRTAVRSSPRRCWTRRPACACSTPAPRPAARPCISRSARRISANSSPSTTIRCACSACATTWTARGAHALLLTADLRARPASLAPDSFDRVLVDAPCSATGVIRRHPDIKLLRRPGDIAAFAADAAADFVAPPSNYCGPAGV